MDDYVRPAEQPWPQMLATTAALRSEATNLQSPMHEITRLVLPPLDMTVQALRAQRNDTAVDDRGDRARRLSAARRNAPSALVEVVPAFLEELPVDPTSGEPFRYARTDVGYVCYSPATGFPVPYDDELDAETAPIQCFCFAGRRGRRRYVPRSKPPRRRRARRTRMTDLPKNGQRTTKTGRRPSPDEVNVGDRVPLHGGRETYMATGALPARSQARHKYQLATERYGRHRSPCARIADGLGISSCP